MLEVGGVKYEEEVVQFAEWPARKESECDTALANKFIYVYLKINK